MKQELIQLLLKKDFYLSNKHRVRPAIFEDSDLKPLYRTLINAHDRMEGDLTVSDLAALYDAENPALTSAKKENVKILLRELANKPALSEEVGEEVLLRLYQQEIGKDIANIGVGISHGEIKDLSMLKGLIDKVKEDFTPEDDMIVCPKDVDVLLADTADENRWQFNIRSLHAKVPGVAPGELCIIFARPETGKTASHVSFCYGPGGFAEQGASVHTLVNEEPAKRTMVRAISSWTGMSKEEIYEDSEFAKAEWKAIYDNVNMFDAQGMSIEAIDAYCETHNPDILVVDQLDKVNVQGVFARTDEKLRAIYTQAREIAKRHNLAFIAISQASADAEGKTRLNPTEMEGSKTGKFAEADLIIGIGRHEYGVDEEPDYTRHLTVGKNKITGWHGTIVCLIEPRISRYVD